MARPKKSEARSVRLNLRFTPSEWVALAQRVAVSGLAPTEYCQRAVLNTPVAHVAPRGIVQRADPALIVAINRLGVDLHQIARGLQAGSGLGSAYLTQTLVRVNQYLDAVQT